jgi:hypothetical protein
MSGLIRTEYVRPPVPTTMYDWVAYVEGEEDGEGNGQKSTGYGPTECEALRDLCEQLAVLWLEARA